MKHMLLLYGNQEAWDALGAGDGAGMTQLDRTHRGIIEELTATGELLETNELSVVDARVVRTTNGVPSVTDGPFVETKEIVGGFYLLDTVDLERAVSIAGRFAEAEFSVVEVRRVGGD